MEKKSNRRSVSETIELIGLITTRGPSETADLLILLDDGLTSIVFLKRFLMSGSFDVDVLVSAFSL
jgi:hypothetical protein